MLGLFNHNSLYKYIMVNLPFFFHELCVKDIMTAQIISAPLNTSVVNCVKIMKKNRVGTLLIEDSKKNIVGILTESDIISAIPKHNIYVLKAKDIMTNDLITISPDATIIDASNFMFKKNVKRLPVEKDRTIVGLITYRDILRAKPEEFIKKREMLKIRGLEEKPGIKKKTIEGYCEECHNLSENLQLVDGKWLCEHCVAMKGEDGEE